MAGFVGGRRQLGLVILGEIEYNKKESIQNSLSLSERKVEAHETTK